MSWSEVKKINSDLNTPLNEGGVKIVKSVQRGSVNTGGRTTSITINEIDVEKSILILVGNRDDNNYPGRAEGQIVSSTEISILSLYLNVYWQVVEFY